MSRRAEVLQVEAELDRAIESRTGRVAIVRGPAGVGRTTLLRSFEQRARQREAFVIAAGAQHRPGQPFSLIAPVLEACLGRVRAVEDSSAWRRRVAALLGTTDSLTAAARADAAELVLHALRETPAVILLDDVDAADAASVAVLQHLVARLTVPAALRAPDESLAGCLLLLSARDAQFPSSLEQLCSQWPTIALQPLDLEGVRQFLAQSETARRAYEATGGLPSRLEELLTSSAPVDLARRRLEQLPAADQSALRALAVVGHPVDADHLSAVLGRKDLLQRLTKLAAAHLVQVTPGAGRSLFAVARESDRSALLEALSAEEARALHRASGAAFEARGDLASAFEQFAAAHDVPRATSTGLATASRLIERAVWETAEATLLRLLSLAPASSKKAAALLSLALVREKRADIRGALAALGRARPLLESSRRPEVRARAARLCLQLGAPKAAERLSRTVLATADGSTPGFADASVALAEARFLRGAYEEALALSRVSGLPAEHQLLLGNVRGKALLTLGRLEEAREAFQANAVQGERSGHPQEHARALLNVGVVAHRQGSREEARSAYRAALAAAEASPFSAIVHANLSSLALEEGQAEEALVQAHRALSAFARDGRLKEQAHATQNLGRVYLYLGDLARAHEVATHAAALADRVGDPYLEAGARLVAAEVRLARREDTAAELEAIAGEFERLHNPRYFREALLDVAQAHVIAERWPAAAEVLEKARAASALSTPALAAEWQLLSAEVALAGQQVDVSAAALSEARTALVSAPQLELPARLFLLSAIVAERRGDAGLAQAERQRAARIVEELAARVPPERRALFLARPSRRAVLDAVGHVWPLSTGATAPAEPAKPARPTAALIGQSPAIARIHALIGRLGASSATVLLRGESGTGKELVARALHSASPRKELPLVAVNCGALSEELLLSELFGHERGAFTGAIRERKGRFELADGGTIFLDEIGDISPRAQVALLRVLQERTFERVGGTRTMTVDVRVVCATNRNLEELMAKGRFREDLYYRLRGAELTLPALRERLSDVPLLCEHFFARYAAEHGEAPRALSAEARRLLMRYRWPGNIRELFNVLESAIAMSNGQIVGPEALELFPELFEASGVEPPPMVPVAPAGNIDLYELLRSKDVSLKDLRRELDVTCISRALAEGDGNISEAARLLKMKRSRLSQIVNAEPELRALCRGGTGPVNANDDEDD